MLEKIVLDNGLNIYLVNDNKKHSTYINLIVKFGGINSKIFLNNKKINIKSGTAHFLEHLVLECSKYGDLMSYFGNRGIRSNGLTSIDRTHFYIDTVEENISNDLRVLLNGIHNPIINKENIEKIRGPILAEKRRSLDKLYSDLYNISISSILKKGNFDSILGNNKDINNIKSIDLQNAFDIFYRPLNEVIIIGGRFNKDEVINTIKDIYKNINFSTKEVREYKYRDIYGVNNRLSILKEDINIEKSIISFKIPMCNISTEVKIRLDNYFYYFLRSNFGVTSKLNQNLKKKKITIGNIGFSSLVLDNSYIVRIESFVKDIIKFNDIIIDYFINKKFVFDEELFNLYKKNTIIDYVTRKDNIYNTIDPLIENIISFNYEKLDSIKDIDVLTFKEYKKTISSISFNTYSISYIKRK